MSDIAITTIGIILFVLILGVVFFLLTSRFKESAEGEINTPIGKGKIKMTNSSKKTASGKAEVSGLSGKNVTIGDVAGAKGTDVSKGEATVKEIRAKENIDLGNVTGLTQSED